MNNSCFEAGIYKFNKPLGWTSFDVVNWVKYRSTSKKVGHAGTLDPQAEGLLIIAVGKENTKKINIVVEQEKEYVFEITLGITTDTYDSEGSIIAQTTDFKISQTDFENCLKSFLGQQQQIPPMFSAVKKNGKKLYELARQGIEIEREPKNIEIQELELLEFNNTTAIVRTVCSKGTYIRTLCYDIGQKLGVGAYMSKLKRTRIGHYTLDEKCLIPTSGGR